MGSCCPTPKNHSRPKSCAKSHKMPRAVLKNEDGPTVVEYVVMLALIVVVCTVPISDLGNTASQTFTG